MNRSKAMNLEMNLRETKENVSLGKMQRGKNFSERIPKGNKRKKKKESLTFVDLAVPLRKELGNDCCILSTS
jgi:hypothetical protein